MLKQHDIGHSAVPAVIHLSSAVNKVKENETLTQMVILIVDKLKALDNLPSTQQAVISLELALSQISQQTSDLINAVNSLNARVLRHATAIEDLASKLDSEDVTDLDTDYEETVSPNL